MHKVLYFFNRKFISLSEYIRDIRDIRRMKRSESNTEIQSLNMFKSDVFTIRKVQIRANIKCFEYFGQPTCNDYRDLPVY